MKILGVDSKSIVSLHFGGQWRHGVDLIKENEEGYLEVYTADDRWNFVVDREIITAVRVD